VTRGGSSATALASNRPRPAPAFYVPALYFWTAEILLSYGAAPGMVVRRCGRFRCLLKRGEGHEGETDVSGGNAGDGAGSAAAVLAQSEASMATPETVFHGQPPCEAYSSVP
jgi:hypothetical protein